MSPMHSERACMERALTYARRGSGFVAPNPLVGAVVEKDGKILGTGWHRRIGGKHAEVDALEMAGDAAAGATLYVTLEPCNHFGRTPPCTDSIIGAGITRVIFALRDPNPKVKGGGAVRLREAGIVVEEGFCADEAEELNRGWLTWVTTGMPYVMLKLAVSLDGCLAAPTGDSKWISSTTSRAHVQRLRRYVNAVMVGAGTILADNPHLTNRTGFGRQPLRVLIDSELSVPVSANICRPLTLDQQGPVPPVIVATTTRASFQRRRELELAGIEVVVFEGSDGRVDIPAVVQFLGERGVQSIMCEGGARLATTLLTKRLCHRLLLYHAPMLVGRKGRAFFEGLDIASIADAERLRLRWSRSVGDDVVSLYEVATASGEV